MRNGLVFFAGAMAMLALLCFTGNVHQSPKTPAAVSAGLVLAAAIAEKWSDYRRRPAKASTKKNAPAIAEASQVEMDVAAALEQLGATKARAKAAAARATKEKPQADFNTAFNLAMQWAKGQA